jgi:hypothetical protein
MRVAVEAVEVGVTDEILEAVDREVTARAGSSVFAGVRDVRLRLRRAKGALLCVAAVGFAGGDLVTSTATSDLPLDAIVGALDGLPDRIGRLHRTEPAAGAPSATAEHAAVRDALKRLLARA